jgi:hypothetical protein
METGDIYVHNEKDDTIEIMCVRPKNKEGVAEVCWSTMSEQSVKGLPAISCTGQMGWNTKEEIEYYYTRIGGL